MKGEERHRYLVGLDGKAWGGQGGSNRTDYSMQVDLLVEEGHTRQNAALQRNRGKVDVQRANRCCR
jgi:hypothetical protein